MVELYESLGREVLLDPLTDEELADDCRGCTLALSLFRVVYTRPVRDGAGRDAAAPSEPDRRPVRPRPSDE